MSLPRVQPKGAAPTTQDFVSLQTLWAKSLDALISKVRTLSSSAAPSGSITAFGGASAPSGWLICDGSAVSRSTYSALFAVIGTAYGAGNGSSTFNLPNGQGVFLRGSGSQTIGGISYSGPNLGGSQGDEMQGHIHSTTAPLVFGAVNGNLGWGDFTASGNQTFNTAGPLSDGTNGTPRTGTETRPANVGVNWIIKT